MPVSLSGSLLITGSITTSGTITAQTLVVQTITSSIVNMTGSNIFGSRSTDRQTFTGSMFVTGSGTFSSTISAIGESTLFQGVFNDPVPNTVAVLKMSSTPTPSLLSTVVGARMSGSATANFDTYAGYFSNIALSSGNGMSYGIFATASFHTFIGETRFAQGVFNDPINGTAASVKISATPRSGAPTAVFTVGITGTASSGQNTFAGYFTNTSTVSGGGVNYGIYATGSNHFFGGNVGVGTTTPSTRLNVLVDGAGAEDGITLGVGSNGDGIKIVQRYLSNRVVAQLGQSNYSGASDSGALRLYDVGGVETIRLSGKNSVASFIASGSLGIGTSVASGSLTVQSAGAQGILLEVDTSNSGVSTRIFGKYSGGQGSMRYDSRGWLFNTNAGVNSTSGTERFAITPEGYVRLMTGTTGLQFSGNTGAANALNYYEEGTWTPILSGTTGGDYTAAGVNSGKYTRVGNVVTITCTLNWSGGGPYSGNLCVKGVPFTNGGNRCHGSMGAVSSGLAFTSGYSNWSFLIDPGFNAVYIIQNATSGGGYSHGPSVSSSGLVYALSVTYLI